MNKLNKIILLILLMLFGISMYINYYISQPREYPEEMCLKGKYLVRMGDDGSVYTRVKEITCDVEGDIIILEERK